MSVGMATFNWDAAPVKTGTTADPAAGAQVANIVVPTGKRWRIYAAETTIVCDATVANRQFLLYMFLAGGVVVSYAGILGLVITASQTKTQSWMASSLTTTAGTQYGLHFPLIELPPGAIFQIWCNGIVAGDNITSATYYYKEAPA